MMNYFNSYVTYVLEYKRLNCQETVICPELNLVMSLCKLLEIFATKDNGVNPNSIEQFEECRKIGFYFGK